MLSGLLLTILVLVILSYAAIAVGYVIGMLFAITPYIGEWLTTSVGLSPEQLPTIFAWLSMTLVVLIYVTTAIITAAREGGK